MIEYYKNSEHLLFFSGLQSGSSRQDNR